MNNYKIVKSAKTKLGNEIKLIGEHSAKTLIIGVFHGDEPQGKYLIEEYLSKSMNASKGLLFIPCLNPDGMQLGTRTNVNGVDLNRNFPTKNWGEDTSSAGDNPSDYYGGKSAGSEIETQFVMEVIEKYKLKPPVGRVFEFKNLKDAIRAQDSGTVEGKIVVLI